MSWPQVESANKDPDPAGSFRNMCSGRSCEGDFCQWHTEDGQQVAGRKICPLEHLAPAELMSELSERKRTEYDAYNVIGFGGGGAALEYNAMMHEPFAPGRPCR